MDAEPADLGAELQRFRAYLHLILRGQVEPRLQAKLDLSGVVQQTLLDAYKAMKAADGSGLALKAAWLRQILSNNLRDEIRRLRSASRDVTRERSLDAGLDQSSARLDDWLAASFTSPSEQAVANERALLLAEALNDLPDAQREAIVLQHWHGWSLAQIAEHLGRTPAAVAGLLHRGLKQLRKSLEPDES